MRVLKPIYSVRGKLKPQPGSFQMGRQGIRMGENAKLYIIKVCSVTRGKFPDIHGYPSLISTVTILH